MDFQYLKDKIYRDTQPKRINGKKMNGSSLARFIMEIVNSINSNAIPNINNSWDKVVTDDIIAYKDKALNYFRELIRKYNDNNDIRIKHNSIPEEKDILMKYLLNAKLESIMKFNKILIVNSDIEINKNYKEVFKENKTLLEKEIEKIMNRTLNDNNEKSSNFNGRIIRENYRDIERKINDDAYNLKNFGDIGDDINSMNINYLEESKGISKGNVYSNFFAKNVNKNVYEYINKLHNEEFNKKIRNMDFQIKTLEEEIEDMETENNRIEDNFKNKIDYVIRIFNLFNFFKIFS